ncbi:MAG: HTH domain-containing protein [Candidatus Doudnabacteria bacterium]|nr:HTH domain-containing protein [Candidatus Doudnabacteria bacterium]
MREFLFLAVGFLIGVILTRALDSRRRGNDEDGGKVLLNPEQVKRKEKNLQKIMRFMETHEQLTNDEVERMLNVSNNTAERYLDELEKQGRLRQIGRTGRSVIYRKP